MPTAVERLVKRLETSWKTYILPEADNKNTIVLHMFDDMWVAFDKSAYFLYQSCANASPMIGRVASNPFPIVMCVVPKEKLDVNPTKAEYKDSNFHQRRFSTNIQLKGYPQWLRSKVNDYKHSDTKLWYFEIRDPSFMRMICS